MNCTHNTCLSELIRIHTHNAWKSPRMDELETLAYVGWKPLIFIHIIFVIISLSGRQWLDDVLDARAPAGYYTVACAAATGTGHGFPLMNCAQLPLDHYSNYCEGLAGVLATAPPLRLYRRCLHPLLRPSSFESYTWLLTAHIHWTAHIVNLYFVLTTLF